MGFGRVCRTAGITKSSASICAQEPFDVQELLSSLKKGVSAQEGEMLLGVVTANGPVYTVTSMMRPQF